MPVNVGDILESCSSWREPGCFEMRARMRVMRAVRVAMGSVGELGGFSNEMGARGLPE